MPVYTQLKDSRRMKILVNLHKLLNFMKDESASIYATKGQQENENT